RRGPRVRHVREQRAERDHELDLELPRNVGDETAERAPAEVRLDAEHDDRVTTRTRQRGVQERVLGPLDLARVAVDERDRRPRRLEVVEVLGVDRRELDRGPRTREVGAGERGALAAVVPAAERGDHHGALERWARIDAKLVRHPLILRGRQRLNTNETTAAHTQAAMVTCASTSHQGSSVRYCTSPIVICTARSPRRTSAPRTCGACARQSQSRTSAKKIPKTAVARTCQ